MNKEQLESKVQIIKLVILTKLNLVNEYMSDNLVFKLIDYDEDGISGEHLISELFFELEVDLDCIDCDFEPESIGFELSEFINKLYKSCDFKIDPKTLKVNTGVQVYPGVKLEVLDYWSSKESLRAVFALRLTLGD